MKQKHFDAYPERHSLSTYLSCAGPRFYYVLTALLFYLLFAFAGWSLQAKAANTGIINNIRSEVRHADTYYWLGMHEKGNVDAFHRGLSHLAAASKLLKSHHDISSKDTAQLDLEIKTLDKDLHKQLEVHGDTLYGIFPLLRLLQPTLFSDDVAAGTFELVDNPDVMASTAAGKKLCHQVLKSLSGKTQFHVLFNSIPRNIELENEMINIFNNASGFFVHNQRELADILNIAQLEDVHNGKVSLKTQQQINQGLDTEQFLLVTIRKVDQINKNYFYVVDGQVYNFSKGKTYHCAAMGFSRNRNGQFWPVILSQIALFLTVIFFTYFTTLTKKGGERIKFFYFLAPVAGFSLGRFIPWLLIPILSPLAPKPDTLAILSFWWPLGLLFVLFSIPVFIYYLSNSFFQVNIPSLVINNRGGLIMSSVALGICAYFATPIYLYAEGKGIIILLALILASVFLFYHLGNLIDPSESTEHDFLAIIILLLLLVQGGLLAHMDSNLIWIYTIISSIVLLAMTHRNQLHVSTPKSPNKNKEMSYTGSPNPAITIEELKSYTINPPFTDIYHPPLFKNLVDRLSDIQNSATIWIGISGYPGIGKTTVINNALSTIKQNQLLILFGNCPKPLKPSDRGQPYAPFQSIFATSLGIDITGSGDHKVKNIGTLFSSVIHTIIPTLQLSPESNLKPCESCLQEIYYNIAQRIRIQAEKQPVAIIIDDVQWIDEDSAALLTYLLTTFPEGNNSDINHAIVIIVAGRDKAQIKKFLNKDPVEISLSSEEQQKILTRSLNIAPASAKELIRYIEGSSGNQATSAMKKKGMHWVFKIIYWLAQNNYLELDKKQNQWVINQKIMDITDIPNEIAKIINDRIEKVKEHKLLIIHAACLGEIFSGKILAESLGMDKYEVYQILAEVEKATGLIMDIKTEDEYYKFQSPFDLNAIREFFGIIDDNSGNVSQVVRECFARTAAAMEKDPKFSSNKLYEIANHYCNAGQSYASKSTEYCLLAARYACNHYQFDTARTYLKKCDEYVFDIHLCSNTMAHKLAEEKLIVDCYEAHVTGKNREKAAEEGLAYIENHPNAPFHIYATVIRAYYDARKFPETVELGKKILEKFKEPAQQAEAHQFIAIASKQTETKAHLDQAVKLLEEHLGKNHEDSEARGLLGRIYNSLAVYNVRKRNSVKAEKFFYNSIDLKEKLGDTLGLAMSHGGLGRLAMKNHDFDEAISQLEKNLSYAEKAGDFYTPFYTNSNLGDCYLGKAAQETNEDKCSQLTKLALERFQLSLEFLLKNEPKSNFGEIKKKLGKEIKVLANKINKCLNSLENNGDIESLKDRLDGFCRKNEISL